MLHFTNSTLLQHISTKVDKEFPRDQGCIRVLHGHKSTATIAELEYCQNENTTNIFTNVFPLLFWDDRVRWVL